MSDTKTPQQIYAQFTDIDNGVGGEIRVSLYKTTSLKQCVLLVLEQETEGDYAEMYEKELQEYHASVATGWTYHDLPTDLREEISRIKKIAADEFEKQQKYSVDMYYGGITITIKPIQWKGNCVDLV